MAYRPNLNGEIAGLVRDSLGRAKAAESPTPHTITELATVTGIPERTLRRRMHGNSAWNTDELDQIATAMRVPVNDLLPQAVAS